MSRAFITVGLGFGDEGKGSVVEALCKKFNASLVVRYSGGCQCAHHVMGPKTFHPFAQFGSGTFAGVPTYLGAQVIIDPLAIAYEAAGLSWQGVESPIRLLQIHPRCLVTTPLHAYANKEFDKACKHGTCGRGIGMARNMWLNYGPGAAIIAEDLQYDAFYEKLEYLRQKILFSAGPHSDTSLMGMEIPKDGIDEAYEDSLELPLVFKELVQQKSEAVCAGVTELLSGAPLFNNLGDGPIVFEGAQGVLLDENYGSHPHTTWSDVTPRFAMEMCERGPDMLVRKIDEVTLIGVTRCYMTRHGVGPFPTEHDSLQFKDPNNRDDGPQGRMRFGPLDLPLLKYSAAACGGLNYLAVNCLDQFEEFSESCAKPVETWNFCHDRSPGSKDLWSNNFCRYKKVNRDDVLSEMESIASIGMAGYGHNEKECMIQ